MNRMSLSLAMDGLSSLITFASGATNKGCKECVFECFGLPKQTVLCVRKNVGLWG